MRSIALRALIPLLSAVLVAVLAPAAMAAPVNDEFASATSLQGNRGSVDFDLLEATNQAGEPTPGDPADLTVWFDYTPSADGVASFSNCRVDTDMALTSPTIAAYEGSAVDDLTQLGVSHGSCPNGRANVMLGGVAVQSGHTYRIQLSVASDSLIIGGTFTYDFNTAAPANDDFANAQAIGPTLPQTVSADNGLATTEDDEPSREDWGPRNSLWYSWTAAADGIVSLDTCSSVWSDPNLGIDSRIHVFTAGDPAELTALSLAQENDDGCDEPNTLLSHAYLTASQGTTYFIRLSNYSADYGFPYVLKLRWVGAPELAYKPAVSPSSGAHQPGDTLSASTSSWAGDPAVTTITYQWERCDGDGDNCSDISGATSEEYVVDPADVGHRLRFHVTGDNGQTTTYESKPSALVQTPPNNDDVADAQDLGSAATVSTPADSWFATVEDGEADLAGNPDLSASVWYRWTAPESKTYRIATCGPVDWLPQTIGVYTYAGGGIAGLSTQVQNTGGCDDGTDRAVVYFEAVQGTEYYIQIAGSATWAQGDFVLSLRKATTPVFSTDPSLSGAEIEGGELTLDEGQWTSELAGDSNVIWSVCDADGSNCLNDETTGDSFALTNAVVGKRVKATVTATNANGSTVATAMSGVIAADSDGDGFADGDDVCPSEAGSDPPNNGCQPSEIVKDSSPSISGTPRVGETLTGDKGTWHTLHNPLTIEYDYQWVRCAAIDHTGCSNIAGATTATYTLVADDLGKYIFLNVMAHNADTAHSGGAPGVGPVDAAPDSGGGTTDPPAADPFPALTLPKSLGKVKLKKNSFTVSKLVLTCGSAATGPCTGTIKITTAKTKLKGKTVKPMKLSFKLSAAPGAKANTTFKVSSAVAKAIRVAKSLKAKVALSFGAPGWPAKSASSTLTLSK